MRVSVSVCDVCGDMTRDTSNWKITTPTGKQLAVDLCSEHDGPMKDLTEIAEKNPPSPRKKAPPRRVAVTSLEEIERQKQGSRS